MADVSPSVDVIPGRIIQIPPATAVVAKAGYKFNEHFRYGAFVDQTANSKTGNVDLDMNTPMVGFDGCVESESKSTRYASEAREYISKVPMPRLPEMNRL